MGCGEGFVFCEVFSNKASFPHGKYCCNLTSHTIRTKRLNSPQALTAGLCKQGEHNWVFIDCVVTAALPGAVLSLSDVIQSLRVIFRPEY